MLSAPRLQLAVAQSDASKVTHTLSGPPIFSNAEWGEWGPTVSCANAGVDDKYGTTPFNSLHIAGPGANAQRQINQVSRVQKLPEHQSLVRHGSTNVVLWKPDLYDHRRTLGEKRCFTSLLWALGELGIPVMVNPKPDQIPRGSIVITEHPFWIPPPVPDGTVLYFDFGVR